MGLTTWTKAAQKERLAQIELYEICKAAGEHDRFRQGLCVICEIGPTPHRECSSHGPFLNGKCRDCGQVDNPVLDFVQEAMGAAGAVGK
jgi:hypothetical protein